MSCRRTSEPPLENETGFTRRGQNLGGRIHLDSLVQALAIAEYLNIHRSYVNKEDGGDFLRQSVKESAADLKALEDRETLQLMVDGISCGLTQGADGFCRDWELMEIDMCAEARALPHKMHILQGAEDRITRPEFSAAFVEEVPQATLELIENAGNLLFYSHWRRLIDRL